MVNIFKQFDAILSANYNEAKVYLPTDNYRRDINQGWNTEAKNYLMHLGYDEKTISRFYSLLTEHVHDIDINEDMREFIKRNPGFINDVSTFEVAAMRERYQIKLEELSKQLKKNQQELEEEIPDWMAAKKEDKEFIREEQQRKVEYLKKSIDKLKKEAKNPPMYRKGSTDKIVLSWTYNKGGATFSGKNSDGEYSYTLTPDTASSVTNLINTGIYPVAGFGAIVNFYGEKEVIFINSNLVQ